MSMGYIRKKGENRQKIPCAGYFFNGISRLYLEWVLNQSNADARFILIRLKYRHPCDRKPGISSTFKKK
ncbi:hypothetical protein SAMN05444412_102314 [Rhodonellum ikkaensis]|uniref:Uncharacterized protein n=1 Tax=Rhodonellum ikkaensis TaxID=336829 RepID=A0A1H3M2C4_9BACT|nr:hypothetical protein SAMN05444412_102314 [Rhodonellum ikkaensis]